MSTATTAEVKRCRMCGEFKTVDNFYPHKMSAGGYDLRCKACHPRYKELAAKREEEETPTIFTAKLTAAPRKLKPKGTAVEPVALVLERCSLTGEWAVLVLNEPPLYSPGDIAGDYRGNHSQVAFNKAFDAIKERFADDDDN